MKNNAINLRTNTGRCLPLSIPQDCAIEIPDAPPGQVGVVRFSRPPLTERGCCVGNQSSSPMAVFSSATGELPAPPPPVPRGLNLRTTTGKCTPLKMPQDCGVDVDSTADNSMSVRFARPPLSNRGCCDGPSSTDAPPSFIETGDPLPEPPVPPSVPVSRINLRTTTGRCMPLAAPQDCDPGELADVTDASVVLRYTRPPLNSRACCAGDQQRAPVPQFDLTVVVCEHIALEDGLGFFALENGLGTFLLECAP